MKIIGEIDIDKNLKGAVMFHVAKIISQKEFYPDSLKAVQLGDGISKLDGKLKKTGFKVSQAYSFDAEKFPVEKAKEWLKNQEITFSEFFEAKEVKEDDASDVSLDEKTQKVRDKFWETYQKPAEVEEMKWCEEVFDDHIIAQFGDKMYSINYSTDAEGVISFDERDKWVEVEEKYLPVKSDEMVASFGGQVKVGKDGRIGGKCIAFSNPLNPDTDGEYFDKTTDFSPAYVGMKGNVYFNHCLPFKTKDGMKTMREKIGEVQISAITDDGIEVDGELLDSFVKTHDAWVAKFAKTVKAAIDLGKMGWSTGTASHLIKYGESGVKGVKHIKRWSLGLDFSITPTPAGWNQGTKTVGIKSVKSIQDVEFDLDEDEAINQNNLKTEVKGEITMTKEEIDAQIQSGIDARMKAVKAAEDAEKAKLEAEKKADEALQEKINAGVKAALGKGKPINGVAPALNLKTGLGDDASKAFNHYIKTGDASGIRTGESYEEFQREKGVKTEYDLLASTQYQGAEAMPTETAKKIIEKRDPASIVRLAGAEIIQASSSAMIIPIEKNSPQAIAPVAVDGTTDFVKEEVQQMDKVSATVYLFPVRVPVDITLLEDASFDVEGWLARRLARKMAVTENKYFTVGTGSSQPQGLVAGSAKGRDCASATVYTFADINALYASLASEYRDNVSWFCTGADEGLIRGLTGNPPYFIANSTNAGAGDYGYPQGAGGFIAPNSKVFNAADMDAIAASKKPLVVANMSAGYTIVERKLMTIIRDPFTLSGYGMVQIVAYFRVSGYVTNSAAIKHLLTPSA